MKFEGIHERVLKDENNSDPKVSPLFCPTKLTPYSTNFVLLRRSWKPKNSLKRVIKCTKTYSYLDIKENTQNLPFIKKTSNHTTHEVSKTGSFQQ